MESHPTATSMRRAVVTLTWVMFVHFTDTDLSPEPAAHTMALKMLPHAEQAESRQGSNRRCFGLAARAHALACVGEMRAGVGFASAPSRGEKNGEWTRFCVA